MNAADWISAIRSGGLFIHEVALKMLEMNTTPSDLNTINEVLLYGAENEKHVKEIGLNNLLCIYYRVLHANKTVDVCVPSFASDTFAKCLIKVHQSSNVKIRIIIHNSDDFKNLQLLALNGIEVKVIKPDVRLEHDFLLIDAIGEMKDAIAVMGALDYDTTRVNCNRDATVLTSETVVVTALKEEFDRVWNSVCDIRYKKDDKDELNC